MACPFRRILCVWEREIEGGALIYRSLRPDLPSVAMDDALNGSQFYSIAFKLFSKMQTLKHAEQFIHILHIEAGAVILHEHLYFMLIFSVHTANLDFGPSPHAREFEIWHRSHFWVPVFGLTGKSKRNLINALK